MLEHRSGTLYEDMYWIDAETATVVAKETESRVKSKIIYSKKIVPLIRKNRGLITIHTHPSSSPSSISDLSSNYIHEYSLGVVCGHNGKVYVYTANEEISLEHYDSITGKLLKKCKNKDMVSELMLQELQKCFDVIVKEVE